MKIKVEANACFKEVDHSKKRYIVMKGSAGSGKSMDSAQNYIIRLMNDPGRNLLCVRKADVTNRDSTFAELQSAIFRMFGESYKKYWYINTSNMLLECKNNHNQIIFRGVNDEKQRENWSKWDGESEIASTAGHHITLVECDQNYKAVRSGDVAVTVNPGA